MRMLRRAFRELLEPYRREPEVHCHHMLGSFTDAQDVTRAGTGDKKSGAVIIEYAT